MKIKLKKIKIHSGYHFHLTVVVNGTKGNFVLDTGASNTVVDINKTSIFNIKINSKNKSIVSAGIGNEQLNSVLAKKQTLGFKEQVVKTNLVLIDLSYINQLYQKLNIVPVDGILGCDLLFKLKAKIDLYDNTLTLRPRKLERN